MQYIYTNISYRNKSNLTSLVRAGCVGITPDARVRDVGVLVRPSAWIAAEVRVCDSREATLALAVARFGDLNGNQLSVNENHCSVFLQ